MRTRGNAPSMVRRSWMSRGGSSRASRCLRWSRSRRIVTKSLRRSPARPAARRHQIRAGAGRKNRRALGAAGVRYRHRRARVATAWDHRPDWQRRHGGDWSGRYTSPERKPSRTATASPSSHVRRSRVPSGSVKRGPKLARDKGGGGQPRAGSSACPHPAAGPRPAPGPAARCQVRPGRTRVRIQTETYGLAITLDSARC